MPLIPWKPFFEPFEDLEKYFKDDFPLVMPAKIKGFIPAVDVYEEEKNIVVESPLAGTDPKNVEITLENDVLSIRGKSEHKTEVDDKDFYRREVRYGSFYRTVPLPAHVDGDKARAEYENGILKIVVPKLKGETVKKVPVSEKVFIKKTAVKPKIKKAAKKMSKKNKK